MVSSMGQNNIKTGGTPKKETRPTAGKSQSQDTFEPEPLADETGRVTELRPDAASTLSPVRTVPEPGKPTSSAGITTEVFASDKSEPSVEQMTASSPSGSVGSVGSRKKGEPT